MNRRERRDLQYRPFSDQRQYHRPLGIETMRNSFGIQADIERFSEREFDLIDFTDYAACRRYDAAWEGQSSSGDPIWLE